MVRSINPSSFEPSGVDPKKKPASSQDAQKSVQLDSDITSLKATLKAAEEGNKAAMRSPAPARSTPPPKRSTRSTRSTPPPPSYASEVQQAINELKKAGLPVGSLQTALDNASTLKQESEVLYQVMQLGKLLPNAAAFEKQIEKNFSNAVPTVKNDAAAQQALLNNLEKSNPAIADMFEIMEDTTKIGSGDFSSFSDLAKTVLDLGKRYPSLDSTMQTVAGALCEALVSANPQVGQVLAIYFFAPYLRILCTDPNSNELKTFISSLLPGGKDLPLTNTIINTLDSFQSNFPPPAKPTPSWISMMQWFYPLGGLNTKLVLSSFSIKASQFKEEIPTMNGYLDAYIEPYHNLDEDNQEIPYLELAAAGKFNALADHAAANTTDSYLSELIKALAFVNMSPQDKQTLLTLFSNGPHYGSEGASTINEILHRSTTKPTPAQQTAIDAALAGIQKEIDIQKDSVE